MDKSLVPALIVFAAIIVVAVVGNSMLSSRKKTTIAVEEDKSRKEKLDYRHPDARNRTPQNKEQSDGVTKKTQARPKKKEEAVDETYLRNAADAQMEKLVSRAGDYCANIYNCERDSCAYYDSVTDPPVGNRVKFRVAYACSLQGDEPKNLYIKFHVTLHVTTTDIRVIAMSQYTATQEQYDKSPL